MQQVFFRRAEGHAGPVPHKGDEPLRGVKHAARPAPAACEQAHGGEQGSARVAGANGKAVAGVAAADLHAAALRPHKREARAADPQVAPEVKIEVRQVQLAAEGGVARTRRAAVGDGGRQAEKVAGVHLRDVARKGRAQAVVRTPAHRLALVDALLAAVVVVKPLPLGTHRAQELAHRRAQHFRVPADRRR